MMDSLPTHLRVSKLGIYYFRSAIPKRYQAALKRTEIRRSLGTRSPHVAQARSILAREHFKNTIQTIDLMMRTHTHDNLDCIIFEYFEYSLSKFNEHKIDQHHYKNPHFIKELEKQALQYQKHSSTDLHLNHSKNQHAQQSNAIGHTFYSND